MRRLRALGPAADLHFRLAIPSVSASDENQDRLTTSHPGSPPRLRAENLEPRDRALPDVILDFDHQGIAHQRQSARVCRAIFSPPPASTPPARASRGRCNVRGQLQFWDETAGAFHRWNAGGECNCRLYHARVLILASQSPRRRELLRIAGFDFIVRARPVEECARGRIAGRLRPALGARKKPKRLGARPMKSSLAPIRPWSIDDHVLEKPLDAADARRMLRRALRPRAHGPHRDLPAHAIARSSTSNQRACTSSR